MPNNLVISNSPEEMRVLIFGEDNNENPRAVKVDSQGRLVFSNEIIIDKTVLDVLLSGRRFQELYEKKGFNGNSDAIMTVNTSSVSTYSFYVNNLSSTSAINVRLQISPNSSDQYFIDDVSGDVDLPPQEAVVLIPGIFMKYTRVFFMSSGTGEIEVFYNAQV